MVASCDHEAKGEGEMEMRPDIIAKSTPEIAFNILLSEKNESLLTEASVS